MLPRLGVALLAAAVAAAMALPVRVGPARVRDSGRDAAPAQSGQRLVESRLPAADVRTGEPGSFRVVQVTPDASVADLIFLHGHADRVDNNRELFADWAAAGIHVVAVDLPSHGGTTARGIDAWTTADLAALVGTLDRRYGAADRPLILAGWSFGGLLVTRIVQQRQHLAVLSRRPAATVLLVPAVDPLPLTGGDGIARRRTLSHDPDPAAADPRPASPLQNPIFAVRLLAEAWAARADRLPADVPTLVVASDPGEDLYVRVDGLIRWARAQRAATGRVDLLTCSGARHGVHLEPWPTGPTARHATVQFLALAVPGLTVAPAAVEPPVAKEEQTCHAQ
jgi:alpha-beta hydrolase superfamily lysophospholipase